MKKDAAEFPYSYSFDTDDVLDAMEPVIDAVMSLQDKGVAVEVRPGGGISVSARERVRADVRGVDYAGEIGVIERLSP